MSSSRCGGGLVRLVRKGRLVGLVVLVRLVQLVLVVWGVLLVTLVQVSRLGGEVIIFDVQTTPALMTQGGLQSLLESEHIIKVRRVGGSLELVYIPIFFM